MPEPPAKPVAVMVTPAVAVLQMPKLAGMVAATGVPVQGAAGGTIENVPGQGLFGAGHVSNQMK